eukprot:GHVQ01001255.1.p1 GENE.GHVQ01001255.1~~GHVQ01001255.1.p1  ORF type:complete len:297 (+),score=30.33 GHVQ01001255.1:293-1183(+)
MLQFMSRDVGKNVADNSAGVSHRGKRPLLLLYLSIGLMGYALLLLGVFSRPVLVDASSSLEGIERSSSWHRQEPSMSRGSPPVLKAMPCVMMEQQSFPVVKNTREPINRSLAGLSLPQWIRSPPVPTYVLELLIAYVVCLLQIRLVESMQERIDYPARYGMYFLWSAVFLPVMLWFHPMPEWSRRTGDSIIKQTLLCISALLAFDGWEKKFIKPYLIPFIRDRYIRYIRSNTPKFRYNSSKVTYLDLVALRGGSEAKLRRRFDPPVDSREDSSDDDDEKKPPKPVEDPDTPVLSDS